MCKHFPHVRSVKRERKHHDLLKSSQIWQTYIVDKGLSFDYLDFQELMWDQTKMKAKGPVHSVTKHNVEPLFISNGKL